MKQEIYNLRIYLRENNNFFFIDESFSRDFNELKQEAIDRKINNEAYVTIILTLNISGAIIA